MFSVGLLKSSDAAPNFNGHIARPLHFRPENGNFVVENGSESFNRPLYGGNTAFRADAGDKPEISLYLPGRGGVLRFGFATAAGQKWALDAQHVVARYVPGSMVYDIRDPLLGGATLHLNVQATSEAEAVVIRAATSGASAPIELIWAYGGANGERHSRNGDIGTDKVPMSRYFQLQAEHCLNSTFTLGTNSFNQQTKRADIAGLASATSTFAIADATKWRNLSELLASSSAAAPKASVVVGRASLHPEVPIFLSLERTGGGTEATTAPKAASFQPAALPEVWQAAESHRRQIAEHVSVETPDPYVNAAVGALNVAADGVWDEKEGAFMHGAVAWRNKLLGWRGAYSGSELGWPDRTRRHLDGWFSRQNLEPVAPDAGEPQRVPPDTSANYARNEPALHSNGDLSNSHYDMNLVAMDILFRHLEWTGDRDYARRVWPVIERHLAWERRLLRRPFGPQKLPLYEAYVAIWASDDLQYHGGGVTHASAYNYFENLQAARLARLLAKDATPYEREAHAIYAAMQSQLWLGKNGWFAEWKDLLGLQKTHPSAGLWTFYHTVDSQAATAFQAWQMARFVDTQIPHFPLEGVGVPPGNFTLSTTSWMPYTWSTNNVVMAEATHTSLGYFQVGRDETAFALFKGALLDSMYMGLCPGNVGMTTTFDMARGEAQRDFGDGIGATSRALVEGLFGVTPDVLSGEVKIRPGFPAAWNNAHIKHPGFDFRMARQVQAEAERETYAFTSKWTRPMRLRLQIVARRERVAGVTINGRAAKWKMLADSVGTPRIEIETPAARQNEVVVLWMGARISSAVAPAVVPKDTAFEASFGTATAQKLFDPQQTLGDVQLKAHSIHATAIGEIGHRSAFVQAKQGELTWWLPVQFEIRPPYEILEAQQQAAGELRFRVRNNTLRTMQPTAVVRVGDSAVALPPRLQAGQTSPELVFRTGGILPGSNRVEIVLGRGQRVSSNVTNWHITAPQATKYETVDLKPIFNDKVTQIFKHAYLAPRSPYTSLAIPKQGIGSWASPTRTFEVDDTGLRAVVLNNADTLRLPQGIPLQTPGDRAALNIAFTSQWDNFPRDVTVPLSGAAQHIYLLMAGSTNSMQSRFDNGEVVVTYADGSTQRLALENPTTWWPIDQDYKIDDFAFARPQQIPPRLDLKTGEVRVLDINSFKGQGGKVDGGAATVLDLPLQPDKPLRSLTVRTLANEVVIGLMSATLVRP